jgi:hypothetical protein
MTDDLQLAEIDLLAETWAREVPHDQFDVLRSEDPVHWHPEPDGPGFWAVTKHADVRAVSHDWETYSSELGATFIPTQDEEILAQLRLSILNMDPPLHNRARRLVSKAFTPRMIAKLVDEIDRRAEAVIDGVIDRGECDFVEDIAAQVPVQMICEMIGLEPEQWPRMFEISNDVIGSRNDPEYADVDAEAASGEIYALCDAVAEDRRVNPRDDLMTALVQAEIDGERLDNLELNLFFISLVVAGTITRNLINHLRWRPAGPSRAGRTAQDPSLWDSGRGDAAVGHVDPQLPADRHGRHRAERAADRRRRQGRPLLHVRQPRRGRVPRSAPVRRRPHPERPRHLRWRRRALLPRGEPRPRRDPGDHAPGRGATARHRARRPARAARERFREWHQADARQVVTRKETDNAHTDL